MVEKSEPLFDRQSHTTPGLGLYVNIDKGMRLASISEFRSLLRRYVIQTSLIRINPPVGNARAGR